MRQNGFTTKSPDVCTCRNNKIDQQGDGHCIGWLHWAMVAALARQNYFTEAVANNKGLTLYPSTQQCQLSMDLVFATFTDNEEFVQSATS